MAMQIIKTLAMAGVSVALLAACDTTASSPRGSDATARSVGFSDYAQYMRAQEELSRIRQGEAAQTRGASLPSGAPQFGAAPSPASSIGQEAVAAVRGEQMASTPSLQQGQQFPIANLASGAPLSATGGGGTAPSGGMGGGTGTGGVSEQRFTPQPFGTAQPDQLIERDFVPQVRVSDAELSQGGAGPNLFAYALSTQHNVGQARYNRTNPLRWRRSETACARFSSQDLAQEAFLAAGGPERDPNHLDPDGDGFACWWDPTPFRQAARTVRARE